MKKLLTLFSFFLFTNLAVNAQSGNILPHVTFHLNGKPHNFPGVMILDFFPGDTMSLAMPTFDSDNDSISISSNATTILPGSTFNVTAARQPIAYVYWIPTNNDVSLEPFLLNFQVRDNRPPIIGIQNFVVQIRVNKPGSITLNNSLVNLNQEIVLQPGMPMNLRFSSVNPALPDSIKISSTATTVLSGSAINLDNAKQQTADISWTPTAAHVNSQPYNFTVTYQDNAPVPNQYTYTVKVRVAHVLGLKEEAKSETGFAAYPNPFTETVSFKLNPGAKAQSILIYNLLGQQIDEIRLHSGNHQNQISWVKARQFAKGTYVARLIAEDKVVETLKFTKLQ